MIVPTTETAASTPKKQRATAPVRSGVRQLFDALICLAIAVILVRAFQVEGYMISTGSMAPTLPGFHKRVVCPSCQWEFFVGDIPPNYDPLKNSFTDKNGSQGKRRQLLWAQQDSAQQDQSIVPQTTTTANNQLVTCPNCGRHAIDISQIVRNQGDQLLVHKNAYQYELPQRWEVAVFRNPLRPTQAYVKRVVGLPEETVQIVNGDLFINGEIQRKTFSQQRAIRIPVYDHNFEPQNDSNWQPRLFVDRINSRRANSYWKRDGSKFVITSDAGTSHSDKKSPRFLAPVRAHKLTPPEKTGFSEQKKQEQNNVSWVTYRHWIRSGGEHHTSIAIPESLKHHDFSLPSFYPIKYDRNTNRLSHTGTLTARSRDRLMTIIDDSEVTKLIEQLYQQAHLAPVDDYYGYNRSHGKRRSFFVRDLSFSADVVLQNTISQNTVSQNAVSQNGREKNGAGQFFLEMTDGLQRFQFRLNTATRDVSLHVDGQSTSIRNARLKPAILQSKIHIEMSLFDRQLLVAINGQRLFSPLSLRPIPANSPFSRQPVRWGATHLTMQIDSLKIFRDVYYTPKGSQKPVTLKKEEYFVLGDNSPVSADSRVWKRPGVHRRLFLGKPIFVHLPSRSGNFRIGNTNIRVRIPDLSRIRYIR